ncbi:MAG TPA: hypothetical protein VK612_00675 [Pyrinomonadaceae bacterium]|nr:hypothetical protein [Pyrinomonadaceae bacterium]
MLKIVLGVIAGFVAWSVLWLGSDSVLMTASPNWYGAHQLAFEKAMGLGESFTADSTILVMHLVRSIIISLMCGFLAAFIAGENKRAPLILGVLLLAFGTLIQAMAWNYIPIWYHVIFLVLLIPVTVLGGKLKKAA